MKIEYDTAKRNHILKARGLDIALVGDVLAGATLTVADDRKDYGEPRYITIGFLSGRMVIVVWTMRDDAYRLRQHEESQ